MTKNNLKVVKTDNKKEQELKEKKKSLEAAISQIDQNFGKGSVMRLGQQEALDIEAISTGSLSLDLALGIGGLPKGRIIEIYGPESSGKTTLALQVVAEAQKAGGICAFVDAEHAMDPAYAKKLGVKTDELLISQPDTGEQALEITDTLIKSGSVSVLVVDSVAALTPKAELEGEMGDHHVGLQSRLMSQALRKITGSVSKSNTIESVFSEIPIPALCLKPKFFGIDSDSETGKTILVAITELSLIITAPSCNGLFLKKIVSKICDVRRILVLSPVFFKNSKLFSLSITIIAPVFSEDIFSQERIKVLISREIISSVLFKNLKYFKIFFLVAKFVDPSKSKNFLISCSTSEVKIWADSNKINDYSGSYVFAFDRIGFRNNTGIVETILKHNAVALYNRVLTDTESYTITSTQYSAYSGMVAALGNYTIPC